MRNEAKGGTYALVETAAPGWGPPRLDGNRRAWMGTRRQTDLKKWSKPSYPGLNLKIHLLGTL